MYVSLLTLRNFAAAEMSSLLMQAYDDGRVKRPEGNEDASERAGATVFATSQVAWI